MKRTKSSLSLRNLAMSIKQSICLEAHKANRQDIILKSSRSSSNLLPRQRKSENMDKLNKQQKSNRIFILEKQIANLEKELEGSKDCIKNYNKQLGEFDEINSKLADFQSHLQLSHSTHDQIRNQLGMLQEEIISIRFNAEERIAEKQYYEELIEAYQHQYETQSKFVLDILDLEKTNTQLERNIQQIEVKIGKSKVELEEWKKQTQFDLNGHKLKNSIKNVRVQLIQLEDKCDQFCAEHSLRKIRELFCLYFKNYAKTNGVSNSEADNGIDIFICKNSLSEDFAEFIRERLVYNKPKFQAAENYIECLNKMEQIFRKSNHHCNKKLHNLFLFDIAEISNQKQEKSDQITKNIQKIRDLKQKTDALFSNDSIAVIEYLREKNRNIYNIKEIKLKLKQYKKQQTNRIQKIRQAFKKIKELDAVIDKEKGSIKIKQLRRNMEESRESMILTEIEMEDIQNKIKRLQVQKDNVQSIINDAISRWRQRDQNKQRLKQLYQQLLDAKESPEIKITKNHIVPSWKQEVSQISLCKRDICDERPIKLLSKNSTISSLSNSRSILSLSNPYKKIMSKQLNSFQPIISDCQMILSKKLTHKDLSLKYTEKEALRQSNQNIDMKRTKNIGKYRETSKQNDLWTMKDKNITATQSKYNLSMKPSTTVSKYSKSGLKQSERISLSNMLISKFNR